MATAADEAAGGAANDGAVRDLQVPAWPSPRWLKACIIRSLDGAFVGADGRSGSLSHPDDRAHLREVRALSDAVLVGAQTLRVERYRPLTVTPDVRERRIAAGLAPAPRLVIVTRSLDLPWDAPVFTDSPVPPLVVTPQAPSRPSVTSAELIVVDTSHPGTIIDALIDRGLEHITCEGGQRLLALLEQHDLVDEIALTLAPMLVGAAPDGSAQALASPTRFTAVQVRESSGYVFTRWVRDDRLARLGITP